MGYIGKGVIKLFCCEWLVCLVSELGGFINLGFGYFID